MNLLCYDAGFFILSTAQDLLFLSVQDRSLVTEVKLFDELLDEKDVLALDGENTFIILDDAEGVDKLSISLLLLLFLTQALRGVMTVIWRQLAASLILATTWS